jgi:hypothetical protein
LDGATQGKDQRMVFDPPAPANFFASAIRFAAMVAVRLCSVTPPISGWLISQAGAAPLSTFRQ